MDEARLPIIVGVGEVVGNRDRTAADAREPLDLIVEAARSAAADTGAAAGLLAATDAVYAVRTASWAYDDASSQVAAAVGARTGRRVDTTVGGHWPARLLEQAAARIADGDDQVALLVGGEAQASVTALAKAGLDPATDAGWSSRPGGPASFGPDELGSPRMLTAGVVLPTRVYPLFHNALQADLGLTPAQAADRSAQLYARFTEVAATNPIAWNRRVRTAADIATVTADNRMICEPYPLAVNAMPLVDQAAAVLVTSVAAARARGIPEDRWVYVHGGAGATDTADVLERPSFARSDALDVAFDRALERTGTEVADIDRIDVYSCFPVVPELVMRHLHLHGDATPTAAGGHAAFGGPLNSYSLHAVASLTRGLRDRDRLGVVHANGGYLTAQHVTVLADHPHAGGYLGDPEPVVFQPDPGLVVRDAGQVFAGAVAPAELSIETWTVEHDRTGGPERAYVIGRDATGTRIAAATAPGDRAAAAALSFAALPGGVTTHIGRTVRVATTDAGPIVVP